VPEPHDELDTWLSAGVKPLLPPPGTFEHVSKQARRRRTRRAVLSTAGALAVAAVAAVVIPKVAIPALQADRQPSAASASLSPGASPRLTGRAPRPTAAPTPTGSGPSAAPPPLSVTFVGLGTGWVMSQAGPAGTCDRPAAPACVALWRTDTGGSAWRAVHPPPAHGPGGAAGVSQVRFLNLRDGWAFGPQLWATHDSGRTWTQIPTGGLRVTGLETRGRRVFAVWARCTGTAAGFASRCTSFAVYSSGAGSNNWAPVAGASWGSGGTGAASAASLVLTGTTAYLLDPAGVLFAGPLTGAAWQPVTGTASPKPAPCRPGPAQPDGQPSGALLAASGPAGLDLLCAGPRAGGRQAKTIYASQDGGQTWRRAGLAPAAGTASSLSGSPSGTLVLATSLGIEISRDGGASWSAAGGTMPPGGFAYVGMTSSTQGVAVPADPAEHAIWFTYDGGSTWRPSPVAA
jgi:photosystem II stability/assembly factor-like uncharacterized protein